MIVRADSVQLPVGGSTWVLAAVWMSGAAFVLLGTARASWRLVRYRAESVPIVEPAWLAIVSDISHAWAWGARSTCCEGVRDSVPVTWGLLRAIRAFAGVLGRMAGRAEARGAGHELAHVARGDWGIQVAAKIVCGIYWFNPLFWIAYRQLCRESEQACDDAVWASESIDATTRRTCWKLPGRLTSEGAIVPVLAIARPSKLEQRVSVLLDAASSRRIPTRRFAGGQPDCSCWWSGCRWPLSAFPAPVPGHVRTTGLPALPTWWDRPATHD